MLETRPAPAALRTLQILVVALFLGVVIFAAIASAAGGTASPNLPPQMRTIFVGLVAIMVPMTLVMRHVLSRARSGLPGNPGETAPDALLQRYFVITIMSAAMLEGPALLGVITCLGSRDPIDLAVTAIPTVLIPLVCFPSAGRWWRFVRSFDDANPFGGP